MNVFLKINKIKGRVKTLQNEQPVKEECPLKIRLEGKLVPFTAIMVGSVYQELQKKVFTMKAISKNGKQW